MRAEHTNEVEERRVIRLVTGLADAVPPLADAEIRWSIDSALLHRRRSHRLLRSVSAIAAAAVLALAFLVQLEAPARHSSAAASGSAPIVSFPEGNALELLLAPSKG